MTTAGLFDINSRYMKQTIQALEKEVSQEKGYSRDMSNSPTPYAVKMYWFWLHNPQKKLLYYHNNEILIAAITCVNHAHDQQYSMVLYAVDSLNQSSHYMNMSPIFTETCIHDTTLWQYYAIHAEHAKLETIFNLLISLVLSAVSVMLTWEHSDLTVGLTTIL